MFAAFVGVLAVLCFIVLAIVLFLLRLLTKREDTSMEADEAHTIQELYRTLERLEKRTEVLETLLAGQDSFGDYSSQGYPQGRK